MKIAMLFGAGASYGAGGVWPAHPPLGDGLFDALAFSMPSWDGLPDNLASRFRSDFESTMDWVWRHENGRVRDLMVDMALYFGQFDLSPTEPNCYLELLKEMKDARAVERTTFCSLNYDCLLELAAGQVGYPIAYSGYRAQAGEAFVLKPHGSCNFVPPPEARVMYNVNFDLSAMPGQQIMNFVPAPVSPQEVAGLYPSAMRLAIPPAICAYAPGKPVLVAGPFIDSIHETWVDDCLSATRVFVIGARVNPADRVFEPVLETKATVWYVGADEDFEDLLTLRPKKTNHLGQYFKETLPEIRKRLRPH